MVNELDPEAPEPELTREERRAERQRLRKVRRERRRQELGDDETRGQRVVELGLDDPVSRSRSERCRPPHLTAPPP